MASSFPIAEDTTATLHQSPLSPDQTSQDPCPSSPSDPNPADSTTWTHIGRSGKRTGPDTSAPQLPPPPDSGVTLETLYRDYRREQRRWHTTDKAVRESYEEIFRSEIPDPATLPLDTVVCVALGSLSGTLAPPATFDGKPIIGGYAREVSMKQLVALEEWIGLLRERGHEVPPPGQIPETDAGVTNEFDDAESQDPYTTPSSFPLQGVKIIQDPCINALDAQFLARLGYTVLPSDLRACSYKSRRGPRAEHAGSHLTASTLCFAPHAPHPLVRTDILPGPGPGVYIGNPVTDDLDTTDVDDAGGTWSVQGPRKPKRARGKGKGKGNSLSRIVRKAAATVGVMEEEREGRDERGEEMTPHQREQMVRWKTERRVIKMSRKKIHIDNVAFSDLWVYVLVGTNSEGAMDGTADGID